MSNGALLLRTTNPTVLPDGHDERGQRGGTVGSDELGALGILSTYPFEDRDERMLNEEEIIDR